MFEIVFDNKHYIVNYEDGKILIENDKGHHIYGCWIKDMETEIKHHFMIAQILQHVGNALDG